VKNKFLRSHIKNIFSILSVSILFSGMNFIKLKGLNMKLTYYFRSILVGFVLGVFLLGCGRGDSGRTIIQVKGSDTEVNLVQALAETFMSHHPDVSIAVTGGGSGTGIAAIINQQTDIANSSRSMRQEEIQQARDRGVEPVAIIFAVDGLALITHETMTVPSLTVEQVGRIYRGEVTNWNEVGGPNLPIVLYGRQSNSGTFVYFRDNVLGGDYSPRMRNMNGTAQIVEAVRQDRAGIGYVGIGYISDREGGTARGIKVVNISNVADSDPVSPLDPDNVISGLYPISRPLYQFTNGLPTENIKKFIQWELSPEGQAVVAQSGYYPVGEEHMEKNRIMGIIE
jgi:phosphate transport system substrate-binding protein